MVTRTEVPASIEGSQVLVIGQKIMPTGKPIRLAGETVYPLDVKKRGRSIIERERINSNQPLFKEYSMVDVGDEISGKMLWGFSSDVISRDDIKIGGEGRTSSHTGQELTINGICFMELTLGWIGTAIDKHPKNALLE